MSIQIDNFQIRNSSEVNDKFDLHIGKTVKEGKHAGETRYTPVAYSVGMVRCINIITHEKAMQGEEIETMTEYLSEYKKIVENTVQKIAKIEKLITNK